MTDLNFASSTKYDKQFQEYAIESAHQNRQTSNMKYLGLSKNKTSAIMALLQSHFYAVPMHTFVKYFSDDNDHSNVRNQSLICRHFKDQDCPLCDIDMRVTTRYIALAINLMKSKVDGKNCVVPTMSSYNYDPALLNVPDSFSDRIDTNPDGKNTINLYEIGIFQTGKSVNNQLSENVSAVNDSSDMTGFVFKISRTGENLNTRYTVVNLPLQLRVSDEELNLVRNVSSTIDDFVDSRTSDYFYDRLVDVVNGRSDNENEKTDEKPVVKQKSSVTPPNQGKSNMDDIDSGHDTSDDEETIDADDASQAIANAFGG